MTETNITEQNSIEQTYAPAAAEPEDHRRRQNLQRLELAQQAARCEHVRADGAPCQAPRLRGGDMCYAHTRMLAARPKKLDLPPLEDASSVQLAIMEVAKALLDGTIDRKEAALLLYGLQIASRNVGRSTFATLGNQDRMVIDAPELLQDTGKNVEEEQVPSALVV